MKKLIILITFLLIAFFSINIYANSFTGIVTNVTDKKKVIIIVGNSRARQMSRLKKYIEKILFLFIVTEVH